MMLVYFSRQHTVPPEQLERNTDSTDLADQDTFRSFYTNSHDAPPEQSGCNTDHDMA